MARWRCGGGVDTAEERKIGTYNINTFKTNETTSLQYKNRRESPGGAADGVDPVEERKMGTYNINTFKTNET